LEKLSESDIIWILVKTPSHPHTHTTSAKYVTKLEFTFADVRTSNVSSYLNVLNNVLSNANSQQSPCPMKNFVRIKQIASKATKTQVISGNDAAGPR